jgi:hypothetical protein
MPTTIPSKDDDLLSIQNSVAETGHTFDVTLNSQTLFLTPEKVGPSIVPAYS